MFGRWSSLGFQIPPEVWCFRYVLGVQIPPHKGVWKPRAFPFGAYFQGGKRAVKLPGSNQVRFTHTQLGHFKLRDAGRQKAQNVVQIEARKRYPKSIVIQCVYIYIFIHILSYRYHIQVCVHSTLIYLLFVETNIKYPWFLFLCLNFYLVALAVS